MYNFMNFGIYSNLDRALQKNSDLTTKSKKKIKTMYQNNMVFRNTYNRLFAERMGDGDFEGTENTGMEPRAMKQSLIYNDCFIVSNEIKYKGKPMPGIYAVSGYPSGKGWNINGEPLSAWICSAYNGKIVQEVNLYIPGSEDNDLLNVGIAEDGSPKAQSVIVWGSETRYPFIWTILMFALWITDSYRTLDVNRYWQKRMNIFAAPKELANTINELLEEMDDNENYVITSPSYEKAQQIQLYQPGENSQALQDVTGLIEWYESKYREIRGIDNNAQMDKKGENLISDEISVNDQYQSLNDKRVCDTINKYLDIANKRLGTSLHYKSNIEEDNQKRNAIKNQIQTSIEGQGKDERNQEK